MATESQIELAEDTIRVVGSVDGAVRFLESSAQLAVRRAERADDEVRHAEFMDEAADCREASRYIRTLPAYLAQAES